MSSHTDILRKVLTKFFQDAASKSGLMDDDKCGLYESSRTDSGFLSSANLTDQLSSDETKHADSGVVDDDSPSQDNKSDLMRLDSGVDVGLSESFSGLCIKGAALNNLNSTKLRTADVAPISEESSGVVDDKEAPWELYYRQDEDGDTQLHIAIINGFLEVIDSLLRVTPHPCLLDLGNERLETPLHLAVAFRHARVARRLVAAGARPDCRDLRGNSPLHLACMAGDLEAVRALTAPVALQETEALGLKYSPVGRREVDLEQRNYDGQMCVHLAALGGHVEVLRHLVWFGANINAREGKSGYTPLHQAIESCNQPVTHFLLTECRQLQIEAPTFAGLTALQLARGSAFVQALRSRGARMIESSESETESDSEDDMIVQPTNMYSTGFAINASA